ncbi:MAG TPA: branched-chain amino acid ABC transporter permease [Bacillales bacterium]|nr:branched-chain amino acid ABC transporter permease [Bacillales bacterium]
MVYLGSLIIIYVIIVTGLNILIGYGGQISIGHASFLAIGAYTSAILTLKLSLPFLVVLPLSGFITAFIGFIVGMPAVKLSGHFLGVATLGFGVAIPEILLKWDALTGGFSGLFPERPSIFGFSFTTDLRIYYLVLAIGLIVTWLVHNLIEGRIGRSFVAIRESEVAATSVGINVSLYKTLMFTISAFYAGIAGSLYAHFIGFISPHDFNINISFSVLAMVVVGGLASKIGPYIGAIVLTLIPQFTDHVPGLSLVVTGAALILIILFLPDGLASIQAKLIQLKAKKVNRKNSALIKVTAEVKSEGR